MIHVKMMQKLHDSIERRRKKCIIWSIKIYDILQLASHVKEYHL
jgi:hypothetical protein